MLTICTEKGRAQNEKNKNTDDNNNFSYTGWNTLLSRLNRKYADMLLAWTSLELMESPSCHRNKKEFDSAEREWTRDTADSVTRNTEASFQ